MAANPLDLVNGFMIKKCADSIVENVELIILQILNAPYDLAKQVVNQAITGNVMDDLLSSPLGQLGQDYLAQTVNNYTQKVLSTIDGAIGSTLDKLENAQQMVFNAILSAMTAQNDLILFLLQRVGKQAILAIQAKRVTLQTLDAELRKLYNALVILSASKSVYDPYLKTLRDALILVVKARADIKAVHSTFVATDLFLVRRFEAAKKSLADAITLLEPDRSKPPMLPFNTKTLIDETITKVGESLGVPDSQMLTVIMSIPVLAKHVLVAADTYFADVLKVNALLTSYMAGMDTIKKVTGGKMKDYTVSVLKNIGDATDEVRKEMCVVLNGAPDAIYAPIKGFRTTPHQVMGFTATWVIQLKVINILLKTVPVKGLESLNLSNNAVAVYQKSVKTIKSKNNRVSQSAILHAVEGSEQTGDLEGQLLIFLSASQRAILDAKVSKSILALGRTAISRLQLSLVQDKEIEVAIQEFVNTKLPDSVGVIGNAIRAMLKTFGLDRAADLLESGNFEDFFNSNTKTATYAGAALVGLQALRTCLKFSPPELFDLDLTLKNFLLAFFLRFKRAAGRNISLQIQFNLKKLEGCNGMINAMNGLGSFCGLTSVLSPSKLMGTLGPALGVGR